MSDSNWVDVGDRDGDDWSQVSLWLPCPGERYLIARWEFLCDEKETRHGHVALSTDDGIGVIPARIESRPFLKAVCDYGCGKGWMTQEERSVVLGLPETESLATELTEREEAVLADPKSLEEATRFGFMSC